MVFTLQHGAILVPSGCAASHFRAYWFNGTLPPNNTLCHPDRPVFTANESNALYQAKLSTLTPDERRLAEAMDRVSKTDVLPGLKLGRRWL
jgi:hypothetical protein